MVMASLINTDVFFYVLNLILLSFSKQRLLISPPVVKLS